MAGMRKSGLKNFALFHAPKVGSERSGGVNEVLCSVWIDGELKMDGEEYGLENIHHVLEKKLRELEAMFMDGCSMGFSIEEFDGVIVLAASPSVCTENLQKALGNNYTTLYMPPWSLDEAIVASDFLKVERDIVEENSSHMRGIARYLFEKDSARRKCKTRRRKSMIEKESAMVHSLVLWQPELKENGKYDHREMVRFELVSRYAEQKVAEKLSKFDLTLLWATRQRLSPVSGAEGYAGALFEAYAIKKISGGGIFNIFSLETGKEQVSMEIKIPSMHGEPVVVECKTNTLSPPSTVPLNSVHVKADDDDSWQAKVLWPLTSNFSTFDCFYFHTDGEIYRPLQMTIAQTTIKNNGAYQTMEYLDKIDTCKRPYKAVFVCPWGKDRIKRQKFTGNVTDGKQILKMRRRQK
jgi:hypothetical protein